MALLKKQDMVPGVRLRIHDKPSTGLPKAMFGDTNIMNRTISYVTITKEPGSYLDGHAALHPGDFCEVVEPPRVRRECGNAIKVRRDDGVEGYAFWCEMRASAELA